MNIFDIFSKREKRQQDYSDVFVYDSIPQELRVQITYILRDAIGRENVYDSPAARFYELIHDALAREYGVYQIAPGALAEEKVMNFLLQERNANKVLDGVELSFRVIDNSIRNYHGYVPYKHLARTKVSPDEAINELNFRFLEHGVGYQYVHGEIIRKDSEFLHKEVVQPTLALLQDPRYKGAEEEFLKAHDHYRHGRTKECLGESLKALESTLKTICAIRKWQYQPTDTAKTLLDVCFKNGLVPDWLQTQYAALRSTLESGVPTVRNKLGGHGQGPEPIDVPPYYAAYMLHLAGTTIHFLVQAEQTL